MKAQSRISGLYAVTPDTQDTRALLEKVRAALGGGVRLVQYRNKLAGPELLLEQARALNKLCQEYAAALIVNDHLDLALAVEADGLHLGDGDGSIAAARARLGADKLLGVSCYNSFDAALAAQASGADYCAFGSYFSSSVKPDAVRAGIDLLRQSKRELRVPVVAIGGITLENARQLVDAGADALAVISALFLAQDVARAAREFSALFSRVAA